MDPTTDSTQILNYCKAIGSLPTEDLEISACKDDQDQIIDCTEQECRRKYCFEELLDNYNKTYVCTFEKLYNS